LEGEEEDPYQLLLQVDSKYTEEPYNNIFEWLIFIDPVMRTFLSEEYFSENRYALYAPID
jgi:hypothetical protein